MTQVYGRISRSWGGEAIWEAAWNPDLTSLQGASPGPLACFTMSSSH